MTYCLNYVLFFLTQHSKVRFFLLLSNFSLSDIRGLYHDSVEVRIPSLE